MAGKFLSQRLEEGVKGQEPGMKATISQSQAKLTHHQQSRTFQQVSFKLRMIMGLKENDRV